MKTFSLAFLLNPLAVTALFECNKNQNEYTAVGGRFVVHYTSVRDEKYDGQPWIRICLPNPEGTFDDVEPIQVRCDQSAPVIFKPGTTGLNGEFKVWNGNGCDEDESDLDGAKFEYEGQVRDLSGDDSGCGPRDHGISCEFKL